MCTKPIHVVYRVTRGKTRTEQVAWRAASLNVSRDVGKRSRPKNSSRQSNPFTIYLTILTKKIIEVLYIYILLSYKSKTVRGIRI